MQLLLGDTTVILLPQKALFLPEERVLVLADLHLGKATHFRKSGIFFPAESAGKDYEVLQYLMEQYAPQQVWFLGDLFHSEHNAEWQRFVHFIRSYPAVRFVLIKGNHDILPQEHYDVLQLTVIPEQLEWRGLIFSHEPLAEVPGNRINVAGHIHPGCLLQGRGRQSLRLPCFYYSGQSFLMPAFGALTGLYIMSGGKGARLFAILPESVVLL